MVSGVRPRPRLDRHVPSKAGWTMCGTKSGSGPGSGTGQTVETEDTVGVLHRPSGAPRVEPSTRIERLGGRSWRRTPHSPPTSARRPETCARRRAPPPGSGGSGTTRPTRRVDGSLPTLSPRDVPTHRRRVGTLLCCVSGPRCYPGRGVVGSLCRGGEAKFPSRRTLGVGVPRGTRDQRTKTLAGERDPRLDGLPQSHKPVSRLERSVG